MARTGITFDQVSHAADTLQAAKPRRPSARRGAGTPRPSFAA